MQIEMTCLHYLYQSLYHPLQLNSVKAGFQLELDLPGVEVEALTLVSLPLLIIYDMEKLAKKNFRIQNIFLIEKIV